MNIIEAIQQSLHTLPLSVNRIDLHPSLAVEDGHVKTLYFGTGLCSGTEMSDGVPFDIVGLLAIAEKVRRLTGCQRIFQLIADEHAKVNPFATPAAIKRQKNELVEVSKQAALALGIDRVHQILLASDFAAMPEFQAELQGIQDEPNEYVRRELADMNFLQKKFNVAVKLSWTDEKNVHDEVFFDQKFKTHFPASPLSFVYTSAAMTFDPAKRHASPYILCSNAKQFRLRRDEQAVIRFSEFLPREEDSRQTRKAKEKCIRQASERMESILTMLKDDFEFPIEGASLPERVQSAIDHIFSKGGAHEIVL